ncbi:MAG: hypothetical protein Q7S16_02830 [bacterium]|nr:hypothetical protein [bacterium]
MRNSFIVLAFIASVCMGGCFTLMPSEQIEKKFLGGPIIVTPEEAPQNITVVSTDADATIIRWETATPHQPVLSLYQDSLRGGKIVLHEKADSAEQTFTAGNITLRYAENGLTHEVTLSGLGYGWSDRGGKEYLLMIDNAPINFFIRRKSPDMGLPSGMPSTSFYPPAGPPAGM